MVILSVAFIVCWKVEILQLLNQFQLLSALKVNSNNKIIKMHSMRNVQLLLLWKCRHMQCYIIGSITRIHWVHFNWTHAMLMSLMQWITKNERICFCICQKRERETRELQQLANQKLPVKLIENREAEGIFILFRLRCICGYLN